jgi:hypothetical protein
MRKLNSRESVHEFFSVFVCQEIHESVAEIPPAVLSRGEVQEIARDSKGLDGIQELILGISAWNIAQHDCCAITFFHLVFLGKLIQL